MSSPTNQVQSQSSRTNIRSDDEVTASNDPTQIKYKKAIREISKLINITKSLRKQNFDITNQLNIAYEENQVLRDRIHELQSEQRNDHHHLSPTPEKNAQEKQLEHTGQISEYLDVKKKVEELEDALNQKQRIIKQLQKVLEDKHIQNVDLYTRCEKYKQQIKLLQSKKQSPYKCKLNDNKCPNKQILDEKIKKSEEYLKVLTEECSRLKGEKIQQYLYRNVANVGSTTLQQTHSPLLYNNLIKQSENKPFGLIYPPRLSINKQKDTSLNLLEDNRKRKSNSKNKKKWEDQKSKYRKQIKSLKKTNEFYLDKYEKMMNFIEKQQQFINKVIYNSESSGNIDSRQSNMNEGMAYNQNTHYQYGLIQNQSEHDAYRF